MTQQTRRMLANVLLGVSLLCILAFVIQHFMTSPRPAWHNYLVWVALACTWAAHFARGRAQHAI